MKKIVLLLIIFINAKFYVLAQNDNFAKGSDSINIQKSIKAKDYKIFNLIKSIKTEDVLFYKLLKFNNSIYVGTNEGIYELSQGAVKEEYSKISANINFDAIQQEFYNNSFDNQKLTSGLSFTQGDYLYEIIDENILVYKKKLGEKKLGGISIRVFSENFIGTYSGIFDYKHNKLNSFPTYTSGYIREIDKKVFVNYDGLFVFDSISTPKYYKNLVGSIELNNTDVGFALDIVKFNKMYILFTTKGVWITDFINVLKQIDSTIIDSRTENKYNPKFIFHFNKEINSSENRVLYYINNRLKVISKDFNIYELKDFNDEVLDIKKIGDNLIYLTKSQVKLFSNKSIVLTKNSDFHTVLPISENIIALSSDEGLFRYNIKERLLTKLISEEFNRNALFIKDSNLLAGGVNGYHKISIDQFSFFFQPIKAAKKNEILSLFLGLTIFFFGFGIALFISQKLYENRNQNKIQRPIKELIEKHIEENINIVTVDLLKDHFQLSFRQLSKNLGETPGKVIENKRKIIFENMLRNNSSINEISLKTGYSKEYVYRIKSKVQKSEL